MQIADPIPPYEGTHRRHYRKWMPEAVPIPVSGRMALGTAQGMMGTGVRTTVVSIIIGSSRAWAKCFLG